MPVKNKTKRIKIGLPDARERRMLRDAVKLVREAALKEWRAGKDNSFFGLVKCVAVIVLGAEVARNEQKQ